MTKRPTFYEVVDCYSSSRHYGYGVIARVESLIEAEALKSVLDGSWDGCDGSYKIKIVPVFKKDFGLEKWKNRLCKHKWSKTAKPWKEDIPLERMRTLKKGLYNCLKCGKRWLVSNREDKKLPAYDGIGYWDEEKRCLIVPKEKELIEVPEEERI